MVPFPCATSSKMVTFPGVTPKDILLYLDVRLTIYSADTVILHAGVNQKQKTKGKVLIPWQKNITPMELRMYLSQVWSIQQEYVYQFLSELKDHLCNKSGICYADNINIRRTNLQKDGLHLVKSGKVILANNVLSQLSKCFLICIYHLGVVTQMMI